MLTNKDTEFIQYLMESTREGKLRWEPTAVTNEFATSLKGKYKINVRMLGPTRVITMADLDDRELLTVTSEDYAPVWDLFDAARRVALDVDSAIDEILKG
ncbi:MAG: hypothetical protein DMG43_13590 [Acidobacteria bacterium]|nr:MAG: hypothetical protein DMG43_13590 [Acidobacteriota bacterium]